MSQPQVSEAAIRMRQFVDGDRKPEEREIRYDYAEVDNTSAMAMVQLFDGNRDVYKRFRLVKDRVLYEETVGD